MRTLFIQQRILDNPSGTLFDSIMESMRKVEECLPSTLNNETLWKRELKSGFMIECGLIYQYFGKISEGIVSIITNLHFS
jgi:hypothetical protein